MKKSWVRGAMLLASAAFLGGGAAQAAGTLTVGMTAGDLPVTTGKTRIAGIKIHDTRMIRLMEVLLRGGIGRSSTN